VLPEENLIIPDFGAFWESEVAYQPKFDDTRMRLRGTKLPAFSNEEGYQGGFKLHVMVQTYGLCSFLSTSEATYRAIDAMYNAFIFASEAQAGQLPVYRISKPRSYHTKYRPDPLYAPVYILFGWVPRSPNGFGPRLIEPPQPLLAPAVVTGPEQTTDEVFASIASCGEALPPLPRSPSKQWTQPRTGEAGPDLDDAIPF